MAFEKENIYDLKILFLMLIGIPLIASTNIDCGGKSFHCLNSTHFMICVDLGGGVSTTVDDFVIPCPPPTVCLMSNRFECEFPVRTTSAPTVLPVELTKEPEIATQNWEAIDDTTVLPTADLEQHLELDTVNVSNNVTEIDSNTVTTFHEIIDDSAAEGVTTESTPKLETVSTESDSTYVPLYILTTENTLTSDVYIIPLETNEENRIEISNTTTDNFTDDSTVTTTEYIITNTPTIYTDAENNNLEVSTGNVSDLNINEGLGNGTDKITLINDVSPIDIIGSVNESEGAIVSTTFREDELSEVTTNAFDSVNKLTNQSSTVSETGNNTVIKAESIYNNGDMTTSAASIVNTDVVVTDTLTSDHETLSTPQAEENPDSGTSATGSSTNTNNYMLQNNNNSMNLTTKPDLSAELSPSATVISNETLIDQSNVVDDFVSTTEASVSIAGDTGTVINHTEFPSMSTMSEENVESITSATVLSTVTSLNESNLELSTVATDTAVNQINTLITPVTDESQYTTETVEIVTDSTGALDAISEVQNTSAIDNIITPSINITTLAENFPTVEITTSATTTIVNNLGELSTKGLNDIILPENTVTTESTIYFTSDSDTNDLLIATFTEAGAVETVNSINNTINESTDTNLNGKENITSPNETTENGTSDILSTTTIPYENIVLDSTNPNLMTENELNQTITIDTIKSQETIDPIPLHSNENKVNNDNQMQNGKDATDLPTNELTDVNLNAKETTTVFNQTTEHGSSDISLTTTIPYENMVTESTKPDLVIENELNQSITTDTNTITNQETINSQNIQENTVSNMENVTEFNPNTLTTDLLINESANVNVTAEETITVSIQTSEHGSSNILSTTIPYENIVIEPMKPDVVIENELNQSNTIDTSTITNQETINSVNIKENNAVTDSQIINETGEVVSEFIGNSFTTNLPIRYNIDKTETATNNQIVQTISTGAVHIPLDNSYLLSSELASTTSRSTISEITNPVQEQANNSETQQGTEVDNVGLINNSDRDMQAETTLEPGNITRHITVEISTKTDETIVVKSTQTLENVTVAQSVMDNNITTESHETINSLENVLLNGTHGGSSSVSITNPLENVLLNGTDGGSSSISNTNPLENVFLNGTHGGSSSISNTNPLENVLLNGTDGESSSISKSNALENVLLNGTHGESSSISKNLTAKEQSNAIQVIFSNKTIQHISGTMQINSTNKKGVIFSDKNPLGNILLNETSTKETTHLNVKENALPEGGLSGSTIVQMPNGDVKILDGQYGTTISITPTTDTNHHQIPIQTPVGILSTATEFSMLSPATIPEGINVTHGIPVNTYNNNKVTETLPSNSAVDNAATATPKLSDNNKHTLHTDGGNKLSSQDTINEDQNVNSNSNYANSRKKPLLTQRETTLPVEDNRRKIAATLPVEATTEIVVTLATEPPHVEPKRKTVTQMANGDSTTTSEISIAINTQETSTITPVFDCQSLVRGRYADDHDCRKFYICSGIVRPIIGMCPVNTVFSEIRKQCTRNLSHCIRGNEFKCTLPGRFSDYTKQNVYYICEQRGLHFLRYKMQCQNGYHLDKAAVRCYETTEVLNHSISSDTSQSTSEKKSKEKHRSDNKSRSRSENSFECETEGKFSDPNDCRRYYVCSKRRRSHEFRRKSKKCDKDEVFNKKKKKCVDLDSYECS